jgi:malate/lactate dehydrogenase
VPTQLGRKGVEKIIEYDLTEYEMAAVNKSAKGVANNIAKLEF